MKLKDRYKSKHELHADKRRRTRNIRVKRAYKKNKKRNLSLRYKKNILKLKKQQITIKAPKILSILDAARTSKTYISSMKFINKLIAHMGNNKTIISFTNTKQITAEVIVMIFGLIQSKKLSGKRGLKVLVSESHSVNYVLKNLKLKNVIEGEIFSPDLENFTEHLPVVSGTGNLHTGKIIDFLLNRIESLTNFRASAEVEFILSDAIQETIHNVDQHAYPNQSSDTKQWWLLSEVYEEYLYLAIFDAGVGIPETISNNKNTPAALKKLYPEAYKKVRSKHKFIDNFLSIIKQEIPHQQLIFLSMQGDVSSTSDSGRGQGSKSMEALVAGYEQGKLHVYSSHGHYLYEKQQSLSYTRAKGLSIPINGTLIYWRVKINES